MARKKSAQQPASRELSFAELGRAVRLIERRISDLEAFDTSLIHERWDAQTEALATKVNDSLAQIFGRGTAEYNEHYIDTLDTMPIVMRFDGDPGPSPDEVRQTYAKGIANAVVHLQSLKESLEERLGDFISEEVVVEGRARSPISADNRQIFLVHGHDAALKEATARVLTKLDLKPIVLHEQPNKGRTIIEKLEAHSEVAFAVVLLTPDDVGHRAGEPEKARSRARQNVVLELGLFVGALGRSRVCALHKGDVELPSDIEGLVYVPVDEAGAWQFTLAREINAAGIDIDVNKLL